MRFVGIVIAGLMFSSPAQAALEDYCRAYAQDIADQIEKNSPRWKGRFDTAQKSCLFRFSSTVEPVAKEKPKAKIVAVKKPAEKTEAPKIVEKPAEKAEPEVVAAAAPKLEPGSQEWTDYCKKKYVSFDESKGTYISKTGVERKCLVTAE